MKNKMKAHTFIWFFLGGRRGFTYMFDGEISRRLQGLVDGVHQRLLGRGLGPLAAAG